MEVVVRHGAGRNRLGEPAPGRARTCAKTVVEVTSQPTGVDTM